MFQTSTTQCASPITAYTLTGHLLLRLYQVLQSFWRSGKDSTPHNGEAAGGEGLQASQVTLCKTGPHEVASNTQNSEDFTEQSQGMTSDEKVQHKHYGRVTNWKSVSDAAYRELNSLHRNLEANVVTCDILWRVCDVLRCAEGNFFELLKEHISLRGKSPTLTVQ